MALRLGDRSSADVVVILLAILIGVTLLLSGAAVFILELIHPEYDTSAAVETSGEILAVIVGAVVGYIAGRHPGDSPTATPSTVPPPPKPIEPEGE